MRIELKQVLFPQPKSKIKAGDGKAEGRYKFFTSSPLQTKFHDEANYDEPSLIFGTGGNASVHFCDEPFSTSTDCLVMYGRSRTELETIYNYLKSNIGILENGFKGAGLKHISKDYILAIEIDLPCETIQLEFLQKTRIIDEVIESKRTQLLLNEDLVKSRFIEMFGDSEYNTRNWPTAKLSSLCDVGSSKRIYQSELADEGIPFLRISDLNERIDGVDNTPQLFIPTERFEELRTNGLVPSTGDILVTARGTLGRCYIIKATDSFYFQDGMISWLSDLSDSITSLYISELFTTAGVQKQIANLQAGSTVAYLSIAMLKKLDIMLPPLALQEQFADFVEQIDKSKFEIQQSLEKLEILKKSLMQQYFG